jgi:hypothetical protein
MTSIIQTPGHAYQRDANGIYTIRNLETGRWSRVTGVDAFMLDVDLDGVPLRAIDGVLARYEAVS